MSTYDQLRHFADSWMLIAMFLFFAGVCIRAYLPRMREAHAEAASVVFRNEEPVDAASPAADHPERQEP
ncbi:cytochrome oxidase [Roseivivax halodurans JCM 10272]|uniref:Cytochrome oxidase n=1 Tax=Roseivivax halodurans JCM 10272 TaxID=1449350 RepID=X7EI87_9RHOB|nr:CcoQ/FixQ family Cbb3-type cytochrome c oxidase assembly chaperone [Roseivivax halodurans]ETX15819.1 cytochrome oxidase [Roseivivax halodurans JCM 10272]